MQSVLKAPPDLFQQISARVKERPELLITTNWHELPNGREAFTVDQITDEDTRHCLAGFVVLLTPGAVKHERMRIDVDEYANEILISSGRLPLPISIYLDDDIRTLERILGGRSSEERVNAYLVRPTYDVN